MHFYDHIKYEHNIFSYINYLVLINLSDEVDFDTNEIYIFNKLEERDLSWMPINRSFTLE